jgi:hypothetical protein
MNGFKIGMRVNLILKMIFNVIAALIKGFKMKSLNQQCLINCFICLFNDFRFLIKV